MHSDRLSSYIVFYSFVAFPCFQYKILTPCTPYPFISLSLFFSFPTHFLFKNTDTKNIISRLKIIFCERFQMACSYMPLHYAVIPCWILQMCLLERELHWICYQQGHCDMLHGEWCPWVVIDTWWFNETLGSCMWFIKE